MSTEEQAPHERPIRSFVRRQGRFTPAQREAFDSLWAGRGLEPGDTPLDLAALFPGCEAFVVEIGFGMGHTLVELASRSPRTGFVGIEVHRPGVGKLLAMAEERGLRNIRVFCHDAVQVLERAMPDAALDALLLFFPDPWHKKRHHKRRLLNPGFATLLVRKLAPDGRLHLATDWQDYAEQMWDVLDATDGIANRAGVRGAVPRPDWRPQTHFETRGQKLGHGVWDLLYDRC